MYKSQFQKIDPYDCFYGPGSPMVNGSTNMLLDEQELMRFVLACNTNIFQFPFIIVDEVCIFLIIVYTLCWITQLDSYGLLL